MSLDPGAQNSSAVVQITLGQVYNVVTETQKEMRDLAHSVQAAVGQLSDHEARLRLVEHDGATQAAVDKLEKEHGDRLTAVERRVWIGIGLAMAVSVGAPALFAYLTSAH